jgi:hypothetical protein
MAARALRERWDVPDLVRGSFVTTAAKMYYDANRNDRSRIAAGNLILGADRLNVQHEALRITDLEKRLRAVEELNRDGGTGNP